MPLYVDATIQMPLPFVSGLFRWVGRRTSIEFWCTVPWLTFYYATLTNITNLPEWSVSLLMPNGGAAWRAVVNRQSDTHSGVPVVTRNVFICRRF